MNPSPTTNPPAPETVALLEKFAGGFSPIREVEGRPLFLRHRDYDVVDLEAFLPHPSRRRSTPVFKTAESFVRYVNNQRGDNSQIFVNMTDTDASMVGVLDFHTVDSGKPGSWCTHRPRLDLQQTVDWKRWMASNKMAFEQVGFALFLEENENLFVEPSGAQLLEIVQTLEGKADVRFHSGIRLQSGQHRLNYEEEISMKGSTGVQQASIELPSLLTVGIAPFEGCQKYKVQARLRYRIESRKIKLWYDTINPHLVVRDAISQIVKEVAEGTKIQPLIGTF